MLDALSIGKLSPGLLLKLIAAKALPKRSLAQLLYIFHRLYSWPKKGIATRAIENLSKER